MSFSFCSEMKKCRKRRRDASIAERKEAPLKWERRGDTRRMVL